MTSGVSSKRISRPRRFDRNLVVIGAGSGGLVSAYIAAAVKARVSLIEKHRMGGDCLNTGCVPSKALIRSARALDQARRARELGFRAIDVDYDFAEVMERVQGVIAQVEPHDSVARYTRLGVDCIQGEARIASPHAVEVDGRTLTTRAMVIATGGRPHVPGIPGIEDTGYYTSDTIWKLRERPERLLVMGGGPIACELAQSLGRLGCRVTLVQRSRRILRREDPEFSEMLMERLREEGVELLTGCQAREFVAGDGDRALICEQDGETRRIPFDAVLVAMGRRANVAGFGLEELDIPLTDRGTIQVNRYLQTCYPNLYAVGDVASPYQFTHTAAHEGWYATVNALLGGLWRFPVDYRVIPWATFTEPEIARVGLNEQEAFMHGIPHEVTTYGLEDLDRAITDGEARGLVKVLTVPGRDRILGVTIAGEQAGEVITEFVSAMRHGLGLNKVLGTIHIYPTLAEANKYVAGEWKRAHAPQGLLRWVERYHAWRRGGG